MKPVRTYLIAGVTVVLMAVGSAYSAAPGDGSGDVGNSGGPGTSGGTGGPTGPGGSGAGPQGDGSGCCGGTLNIKQTQTETLTLTRTRTNTSNPLPSTRSRNRRAKEIIVIREDFAWANFASFRDVIDELDALHAEINY